MNSELDDNLLMRRCFELARLGAGMVSPNPLVGCVVVNDGRIIGEGWHEKYGGPHAEVNAINSVKDKRLLEDATLYVNLEPCAHFGKTPPCADLLAGLPLARIVICNVDPNPLVKLKGIEKLKRANNEITVGVMEDVGLELNQTFFTFIQKNRPYVILKWAETNDGFIAREDFNSKWISNEHSRRLVHRWRSEIDAIMVGTNTAKYDNPQLTVREWSGRNPTRIVIDNDLVLGKELHLFDKSIATICYNFQKQYSEENLEYVKLDPAVDFIDFLMEDLKSRKIASLLVEGGSRLLQSFINSGLWDEARVFTSDVNFGSGIKAPTISCLPCKKIYIKNDRLKIYKNLL
ncbi:MAG TPA: bifunctional diaminohydroxyphosphoribosylaminopyrimidine deaminase/5-amino-6-(5-phosphoribosylamino)uracil reductase RibD [Cytophagaceae bacterium]|jgi:diaminohydroxyphosphoribosylaminopyrimidine deaminase/5-amino-6-(5-phosphoribosylamino)uracil reductase